MRLSQHLHTLLTSGEMNRLLHDRVETCVLSLFYVPTTFVRVLNRPENHMSVCLSVCVTVRLAYVYFVGVKIVSAGRVIL